MSASRVIEVSFGNETVVYVNIDTAYYYNDGVIIKPTDGDLPDTYQVHWADSPEAQTTLETIGTSEGVPVPDELWGRSKVIYGWFYLHPTEDSSVTYKEIRIYKSARAGLPDGTEPTPSEHSTIDQLISAMNTAADKAEQNADSASSDADRAETARNEAETYAVNAQTSASNAEASATTATNQAQIATASATTATTAAQTATAKATEASNSASSAAESASSASDSADSASRSEQAAKISETNAADSESNASTYANSARGYAQTAQSASASASSSATSASNSATSASNSATSASQSAGIATEAKADIEGMVDDAQGYASASAQSASASANSASDAQGYAQSASASAQSASTSASNASTSAQTASTKATEANTSAQTASQKATEAAQSASQALSYKTDAEQAKTASQTAQGLAESARDSAVQAKTDAESARDDAESARDEAQQAVASISGALAEKAPIITDTASGAIASFSDGADDLPLKSLVVDINPVQDLSHGDPSPENICPISGWTGSQVWKTGSNLIGFDGREQYAGDDFRPDNIVDFSKPYVYNGIASSGYCFKNNVPSDVIISSDNCITFTPRYNWYGVGFNIPIKSGATYSTNANVVSRYAIGVAFYDSDSKFISTTNERTFTAPSNAINAIVVFSAKVDVGTVSIGNARIVYGNNISAEYEPYSGMNIEIDLGQTVYGGKLDVLSGELVIDRAMVDLGTLNWDYEPNYNRHGADFNQIPNIKIPGGTIVPNALCSKYKIVSSATGWANRNTVTAMAFDATYLRVYNDGTADAVTYKTAMSGVQLCYELATPIEIQLTPNQINSLYGVNNIWADSGDTTAEYRADTKLFIERLTAPDSADMIADANIQSGKYFMVGNSLYKATANIANGASIIVGTNAVRKSLSEALNEINA